MRAERVAAVLAEIERRIGQVQPLVGGIGRYEEWNQPSYVIAVLRQHKAILERWVVRELVQGVLDCYPDAT